MYILNASAKAPTQRNRHAFSGKEDRALTPGVAPYLDFGARMYSPETGRWLAVDPLAEKYCGIGTHVYCAGNPVNMVAPDGKTHYFDFNGVEIKKGLSSADNPLLLCIECLLSTRTCLRASS